MASGIISLIHSVPIRSTTYAPRISSISYKHYAEVKVANIAENINVLYECLQGYIYKGHYGGIEYESV